MRLQFHPEALAEFAASVARYEQQQAGLGARFLGCVQVAILGILDEPQAWPALVDDVRRRLTHTFPYAILFCIDGDSVLVVAVMHCHQRPGYWRTRVTEP